jgi:beta-glucanase (GH16 family)
MTAPSSAFAPFLQDAADRYAAQAVAAAVGPRDAQISTLTAQLAASQALITQDAAQLAAARQQLAAVQTQLANALASDAADRATIAADQKAIAALQAQLAALQPGKAPAPPAGWVEAFRDDMNGKLGPGWTVANNDSADNELSLRLAANVVPAADHVSIVAKRQTVGTKQFTSGYLTTAGHASWPFFRALVRARWDDLFGMWPALWFRFDNALGEIDGMEAVGGVRKIVQTAHQNTDGKQDKSGFEWVMPVGWSPSDFHVYGTERQADGTLIWSIDGQATRTIRPTDLSTKLKQPMSWLTGPDYAGPAHLIINLQVGGSMPNYFINGDSTKPIDVTKILPGTTTGRLDIDWVQVLTPTAGAG